MNSSSDPNAANRWTVLGTFGLVRSGSYLISHLEQIDPFSLHYKQIVTEREHTSDLAIITWHIYAHRKRTFANVVNLAFWPLIFWIRHRCSQTPLGT